MLRFASALGLLLLAYIYYISIVRHHSVSLFNARYLFALTLFLFTLALPPFSRFFASKLSQFLGRISFSLYLTHFPILCSLSCFVYYFFIDKGYSLIFSTMVTILLSTVIALFTAYLFCVIVEERLLMTLKKRLKQPGRLSKSLKSLYNVRLI
jgi:peptidoglycan/LPS O-acetylase OafA/YrhL